MNLTGHYAPGKYLHAFFLLAIMQTINQNVFVFIHCKYLLVRSGGHLTTPLKQNLQTKLRLDYKTNSYDSFDRLLKLLYENDNTDWVEQMASDSPNHQKRIVALIDLHLGKLGQEEGEQVSNDDLEGFDIGEYLG